MGLTAGFISKLKSEGKRGTLHPNTKDIKDTKVWLGNALIPRIDAEETAIIGFGPVRCMAFSLFGAAGRSFNGKIIFA